MSGNWKQDNKGWWFASSDGSYPRASWQKLGWNNQTQWYRFDDAGYMVTGWYKDNSDGKWYYLWAISDNTKGHMLTGWHLIDGKWYYFYENVGAPQGSLAVDTTTPDGYKVNSKGEWIQ